MGGCVGIAIMGSVFNNALSQHTADYEHVHAQWVLPDLLLWFVLLVFAWFFSHVFPLFAFAFFSSYSLALFFLVYLCSLWNLASPFLFRSHCILSSLFVCLLPNCLFLPVYAFSRDFLLPINGTATEQAAAEARVAAATAAMQASSLALSVGDVFIAVLPMAALWFLFGLCFAPATFRSHSQQADQPAAEAAAGTTQLTSIHSSSSPCLTLALSSSSCSSSHPCSPTETSALHPVHSNPDPVTDAHADYSVPLPSTRSWLSSAAAAFSGIASSPSVTGIHMTSTAITLTVL